MFVLTHLPLVPHTLQWRHGGHDGVSNHQRLDCLINRLFRWRSKETSKLGVTGLCERNSPVTGEFPAQRASNMENASIWWRQHVCVSESGRHWFRKWLVAYSVPSHYPNQCWDIVNWTPRNILQWNFNLNSNMSIHKCIWKDRLRNGGHFVSASTTHHIGMKLLYMVSKRLTGT